MRFVMAAEGAHTLLAPPIAVAARFPATIEQPSDLGVRHQPGQLAAERDRILGKARMVPAGRVERELELQGRVIAALPMQGEVDDWPLPLHHDLLERRAQDPLARVAAVAAGCVQARARSAPSAISCLRSVSPSGGRFRAATAAISPSMRCAAASASFQRRSSSPATRRLAGSTASYCRRA